MGQVGLEGWGTKFNSQMAKGAKDDLIGKGYDKGLMAKGVSKVS